MSYAIRSWSLILGALVLCPAATAQTITEYSAGLTLASNPYGIAAGPDGALWFTEYSGNKIGRITTAGAITEFSSGLTAGSQPWAITAGPDGALWFTEYSGNKIGRITTAGAITEYPLAAGSNPTGIVAGPDGALWFTELFGYRIGRMTTAGKLTEYSLASQSYPYDITVGADGNLWFTESNVNKIGRMTTAGVLTEFSSGMTAGAYPIGIAAGPDGAVWFVETWGNRVGRITTAGAITEYTEGAPSGSTNASYSWIVAGPDGALWFTEAGNLDKIGRITTSGAITDYSTGLTSGGLPTEIAAGPDGALWFTESGNISKIGRITAPSGSSGTPTAIAITNPGFETLPANISWIDCSGSGGPGSGGTGCRDTLDDNVPGWTASSGSSIGLFQPGPNYFTLPLPAAEGQTIAQINSGTLSQTLSATLQASTLYTLQVDVGRRMDNLYPSPPPTALLYAGSTQIASATGAQPPLGGWTTWTGTYQSSASDALAGQALKIVLGATASQGDFDNVRLSAAAGGSTTCTYTLTAASPNPASFTSAGGSGTATVTAGAGCAWTATSSASTWLTTASAGSGNGTVNYSVAANTTTTARNATITVGGQTLTVTEAASSGTTPSSGNLVVNGDAETGTANDFNGQPSIAGWTTDGNVAIVAYSDGGGDLSATSPGPLNRGNNYFAGGTAAVSKMSQTIDVSSFATAIDGGAEPYTLEGWLGGFDGQDDNCTVQATFLNAAGSSLATATIGPVLSGDRGGVTELLDKSTSGTVPVSTRHVAILVTFTRTDGSDNDGLMDNLSFTVGGGAATASTVYYRFENGTANATASGTASILDSMGTGQNGTPSGAVTYSSSVPMSSLNGVADTLSLQLGTTGAVVFPAAFPLNSLSNATLEFYIKPTGTGSEIDFLWTRTDSTDANRFNMGVVSGNSIFLDYRDPNGVQHIVAPSIAIASSGWTHVAVVKTGNTWTAYANGVQQGQPVADANANLPTNTGWTLNGRNLNQFAGFLDELRISNSALTPTQFLPPVTSSAACTYALGATTASPAAAGGAATVSVTAGAGCAWTAAGNASWIAITSGASGTGNGTVAYSVAANTGAARTGTLTIAGQTFTVNQAAGGTTLPLSVVLSPATATNTVGSNGTVTATVTDANNVPQAGVALTFTIVSGPDAGHTGTCSPAACTTNSSGQVAFTYTGSGGAGTDSIQACTSSSASATGKVCCSNTAAAPTPVSRDRRLKPEASSTGNGMVVTPNVTAAALATALLGSGVTLSGTPTFTGAPGQAGTFTNAPALVGFSSGIVLSSGQVADAAQNWSGPNLPSTSEGQPGNSLLSALIGGQSTYDASVLTFSFIPTSSTIYFAYTFASAEYPNYIGQFNDVFGFFVNGKNYALIPGTSTAVSINDVNATTNSQYFNKYNSTGDALPYGGETKVLSVTVPVNPGQVNTITLAIADALDTYLDSAVFIQTGSFSTTPPPAVTQTCSNTVTETWTSATAACTYALGAATASPAAAGGAATVTVTAGTGCAWTATSNASWITITSGASGTGNGTVTYTVAANTAATSRSGTLTIGGQTFTVTQAAAGGGTTPGCNYYVSPLSQNQPASVTSGNITGLILVNTNTGCAWTAASNNSWITIVGGASGNGTGAVSYKVDPNTTSTARTGTMTIAAQTVSVVQAAGTACAYSISPSSNSVQALGGGSSVLLSANPSTCPWSVAVSSSASWLHVTSPTSGSGTLSISYTVDQNTTTQSRTGTITLAGLTFTLTQAGGASATAPNIAQGGVVNAANNRGGSIAQGSFFSIYGANLGPATPVQATSYPIPTTMGNVTVTVTQGSTTLPAYLDFVSATQINAILPSNTPLGAVQITVNYNGVPSTSVSTTVASTAFGIFSTAGGKGPGIVQNYNSATDQPLNMASIPAKPQQIGIIWGTGLGPITTGDNQPPAGGNLPVPVQVVVAGQQAPVIYSGRAPGFAGVDNVYFTAPSGVTLGCYVPVQVSAGGVWSNTVTIALSSDGSHCQDTSNPLSGLSSTGGNLGVLGLIRLNYYGQLDPTQPASTSIVDLGLGDFAQVNAGGDLAQSPFMNLPPVGACKSTNRSLDLGSTMGSGGSSLDPSLSKMLDAGASLTVTGPKGSGSITPVGPNSPYLATLGGSVSAGSTVSVGGSQMPPFLDTGPFTVSGPGGADVGPFSISVNASPAITWTNQMQISTIDRSKPLTLTWSGGDPTATMLVIGGSSDPNTQASGGFTCLASMSAGTFTIPVNTLADLVAVNPNAPVSGDSSSQLGVLGLMPLPMTNPQKFTATGLNFAFAFESTMFMESVQVK